MDGRAAAPDFYVMFIAALLIGSCAGSALELPARARVFMGDTGSQFLGLTLSAVSLFENRKGTAAVTLLLPLVALGVPLADSAIAFLRRAVEAPARLPRRHRPRAPPAAAGGTVQARLFAMWALCAFFGAIAVLLTWLPRGGRRCSSRCSPRCCS